MLLAMCTKADPAPARRAHTPCLKFVQVYFWKFWLHNMHKLYCNQHEMFTICILFITFTTKHRVCVKRHQNNLQTSKIITRRDRAPWFLNIWIRHWCTYIVLHYSYCFTANTLNYMYTYIYITNVLDFQLNTLLWLYIHVYWSQKKFILLTNHS